MLTRAICAVVVLASFGLMAANFNATQDQALVGGALETLGFEFVPDPTGKVGGPMEFEITNRALSKLKGKSVIVDGEGAITIK